MEINVRERNGVTIFDIQGDLSGSNACDLESKLNAHIAKTDDIKILLNLKQVTMIDFFGSIILACADRDIRRKKGSAIAYLTSNSRKVRKALKIFAPYNNEDNAVTSLQ